MVVVIDYGMGNLGSIGNMLKKIGADAVVSSKLEDIKRAERLILPGVGAFDRGMDSIESMGLVSVLTDKVLGDQTPILGICLGMQLFTAKSEEGNRSGLGWINGEVRRFKFDSSDRSWRVPHMGWNTLQAIKPSPLFDDMGSAPRFYFVHSYYVVCNNSEDVLTTTSYRDDFVSACTRGSITGVQFHPEKSHLFGMKFLANFLRSN